MYDGKWMFFLLIVSVDGKTILFNTEDNTNIETYDCIYFTATVTVKYCRRLGTGGITLSRSRLKCVNGGEQISFQSLLEQNISPRELLQWNSSLERVDDYAALFYNPSEKKITENEFLCRCIQPGTFGKFCEYQFIDDTLTFEESIEQQFEEKRTNSWAAQRHGNILCYERSNCEHGLLCLDWRDICDGEQQCSNGYDEYHCDLLEFNECEDDEFRCMNGMCIPDEYWLDGELDCMDQSDEIHPRQLADCFYRPDSWRCDESFCSHHTWSCGDGQCIDAWNRFGYQEHILSNGFCLSHREINYMCEASRHWRLWTLPKTGQCTNEIGYDDPTLDMNQISSDILLLCEYLVRCALSQGFERDCPCNHLNCSNVLMLRCSSFEELIYPPGPLIRPYIYSLYLWNRTWLNRSPNFYRLHGDQLCRGYFASIRDVDSVLLPPSDQWIQTPDNVFDQFFCEKATWKNTKGPQFDSLCWSKQSLTFNGRPYAFDPKFCFGSHRCLSQYRSRDLIEDCFDGNDELKENFLESHCQNIRQHRFSCSIQEPFCIPTHFISDALTACPNENSQFTSGSDYSTGKLSCSDRNQPSCQYLRHYITNSSMRNTTTYVEQFSRESRLSFHRYCNSFWDLSSHFDESNEYCQEWICPTDQYQCQTGQCILIEWLCDGEWDCSDASDEEALLSIANFTEHNLKLNRFSRRIAQCYDRYSNQAFSDLCNVTVEFPCFLNNVSDPLDIRQYRPCIPLKQIGDQRIDCADGRDEKNTRHDSFGRMLGFNVIGDDEMTYNYRLICGYPVNTINWKMWCFYRDLNRTSCKHSTDVICLNGTCLPNVRCNGKFECEHGEDEYRCLPLLNDANDERYRFSKKLIIDKRIFQVKQNVYPFVTSTSQFNRSKQHLNTMKSSKDETNSFRCNRGVTIQSKNEGMVCLCPPSYYGESCEYYHDRLSLILHFNLTELKNDSMFRVIVTLQYQDTVVIDHDQFFIDGQYEKIHYVKHRSHLVYSRFETYLISKTSRISRRENIIKEHPYSIHLNLFQLKNNETIELGKWIYPIYFDFLPSFRFAKVLTIHNEFLNKSDIMNSNHSCPENFLSFPIFNEQRKRYCSRRWNQTECSSYCSKESLCQFDYHGPGYHRRPLCVCPLGHFGRRCHLRHEECYSHPCLNNGTCHLTYDPTGQRPFRCICASQFYGDRCERRKASFHISLDMIDSNIIGSVVQFCNVYAYFWEILVQEQQLVRGIPSFVSYHHPFMNVPTIGLLKTYENLHEFKYFIIFLLGNDSNDLSRSSPMECPHVMKFDRNDKISMVFKYHHVCRQHQNLLCFYDNNYLCICETEHERVYCYLHDLTIDQCNYCLFNGRCLRGNLKNSKDFFCICPRCYQGDRCEFSMEAFGATIDSLLSSYSSTIRLIYLSISGTFLILGLINNICSFVTFQRSTPRQVAVGYFLLIITLLNKLSLICLFLKFLHNFLASKHWLIDDRLNLILCKVLSYLLSTTTRSFYWLASWITIDRLLIVLFPTRTIFKRPSLAKIVNHVTIITILLVHWHELLSYKVFEYSDSTVCIIHFENKIIRYYNRMTTFIHYLLPTCIQLVSIILLIQHVARSRARSRKQSVLSLSFILQQMLASKEQFSIPFAIAISALPQIAASFTLACQDLFSWQRHFLLSTFLLSYIPQTFAFYLLVIPSSVYRTEFNQTYIGRKLFPK